MPLLLLPAHGLRVLPLPRNRPSGGLQLLFCYCPLYALGDRCGGNFRYIGDGIKDCSGCLLPHGRKSYGYVTGKFGEIAELAKKNRHTEE